MFNYSPDTFRKLVLHVISGDVESAKKLLLKESTVYAFIQASSLSDIDYTPARTRYFHNISIFQYALWSLNKDMWEMILSTLPSYSPLLKTAKTQFETLKLKGLFYIQNGEHKNETHFNVKNTSAIFENYINILNGHLLPDNQKTKQLLELEAREAFEIAYQDLPEHFKLRGILSPKDKHSLTQSLDHMESLGYKAIEAFDKIDIKPSDFNIPDLQETLDNKDQNGGCGPKSCLIL